MSKKSSIRIDRKKKLVFKTPLKWKDIVVDREVMWLKMFAGNNSSRFPHFVSVNNGIICMTYCGEPIDTGNCPDDWGVQITKIKRELDRFGCNHNDITADEIVVNSGKMMLVDFGWATRRSESIPESWPINLGITHRIGVHKFDDMYALECSVKNIVMTKTSVAAKDKDS